MFVSAIVVVLLFVIGWELLHAAHAQPHTHSEDVVELWHPPDPPEVPFGWQKNSMFEAAHAGIRQHQSRRDEQTRVAQRASTMGMGTPSILYP